MRGACYIAYGAAARCEVVESIRSFRRCHSLPVAVAGEKENYTPPPVEGWNVFDDLQRSRWAKVTLDLWSPFDYTLYLDADTRVRGNLAAGFQMLEDGWDMAIAPSGRQEIGLLGHVQQGEREATLDELVNPLPLQLQAGMIFFRKNGATARLFRAWRREWLRWQEQDQAALLRALCREPARLWLLGRDWNEGALVEHLFGRAR